MLDSVINTSIYTAYTVYIRTILLAMDNMLFYKTVTLRFQSTKSIWVVKTQARTKLLNLRVVSKRCRLGGQHLLKGSKYTKSVIILHKSTYFLVQSSLLLAFPFSQTTTQLNSIIFHCKIVENRVQCEITKHSKTLHIYYNATQYWLLPR